MNKLWINVGKHYAAYLTIYYTERSVQFKIFSESLFYSERISDGLKTLQEEGWSGSCEGPRKAFRYFEYETRIRHYPDSDRPWVWDVEVSSKETKPLTEEMAFAIFNKATGIGGFLDECRHGEGIAPRNLMTDWI